MKHVDLPLARVRGLLKAAARAKVLVIGDVILDQFIWGRVARLSPEAPVPIVDFDRESYMPGGAANVARNLTALGVPTELFGVVGKDAHADELKTLLHTDRIGASGLITHVDRPTSIKTRVVAHRQQVVRIDREARQPVSPAVTRRLLECIEGQLRDTAAVIICDYGKGVVTEGLLREIKTLCRRNGIWVSLDPKPTHRVNLAGLSLITPNRKEAFELADLPDETRTENPLADQGLRQAVDRLLKELNPALLLITLGEQGMLLCQKNQAPFHIPTVAKEVFDVSGAGDTVIATFTLAIAAGASPVEAAILSNHAAGVVVGKVGTATASLVELFRSFQKS